jgi:hypothetical protein
MTIINIERESDGSFESFWPDEKTSNKHFQYRRQRQEARVSQSGPHNQITSSPLLRTAP